jgi:DNA-binding transcriptional MerR regulator
LIWQKGADVMMSTIMKIGELAKQTGISIRTLHYYDEIGLLSPSHHTEIGHRLYIDRDIIRLQQIMSLRQLGFSLQEIRECLENPAFSLQKVIDLHRTRLQEEIALSHTLLNRLDSITKEFQTTQSVAVEHLIQAMETITMSEQYFTPEQQEVLETRFRKGETKWQELLAQVRAEMSKGTDLNSLSARYLARRWRSLMQELIGGDREIYELIVRIYQREGVEAASWGTLDPETFEYILKAVSFLSLGEESQLVISFRGYTPEEIQSQKEQIQRTISSSRSGFTPEALQVIVLAQDAVRHLELNFVGTEGILLGLLAEGTGIAARVLTASGANIEAVQYFIKKWIASSTVTAAEIPVEIPFTPRACRVLYLSTERAKQLGQEHVDTGHLLLGILKEGEEAEGGLAIRILKEDLGIDLAHLEQQLRLAWQG